MRFRLKLKSDTHIAKIFVHREGLEVDKHPPLSPVAKSLIQYMSHETELFDIGWKLLHGLHQLHHRAEKSAVIVYERPKDNGEPKLSLSLDVSRPNPISHQTEPIIQVWSQTYRYVDDINFASEKRLLQVTIAVKETILPTASHSINSHESSASSADFFDQTSVSEILGLSSQRLANIINEDMTPLDRSTTRLAVYIFELFDQMSSRHQVEEVRVVIADERKRERFWHIMNRSEFSDLADRGKMASGTRHSIATLDSHTAFIALGSNIGDRVTMLETACTMMKDQGMWIERTSSLYETEPMYVEEQDRFINGVCRVSITVESQALEAYSKILQISTKLLPRDLLSKLKEIEQRLGRVKVVDKGPRNIDLDILLYGRISIATPDLTIPHKLMLERAFVMRPLCE